MKLLFILLSISILTSAPNTQQANISVQVKNLNTGATVESHRPNNVVPPASVMKLLTTGCALELLGPSFRFATYLEYTGTLKNGVLDGNLYIRGEGDPSLGDKGNRAFLQKWTRAIRNAGIREIKGEVIADMSAFDADATNPAWIWEDCGNYYAPGVFAVNYYGNTMNITLKSGPIGTIANVIGTEPKVAELRIINHIRCTDITHDGAFVHGLPYSQERYLCGSVPSNLGTFGVKGDLPNPGLLLAQHLTESLRNAGIVVRNEASYIAEPAKPTRTPIYTHYSDSLGAIIAETNIHSNNLYAESIFRHLGLRFGQPGTINNSCRVISEFWQKRGVSMAGTLIKDGCGLAPQDAVSAETFVQLLTYMSKSPDFDVWFASLPISGETGTLRSLGAKTCIHGKVHAKSGTISGTKNFAGYMDLPNGERLVFAILINSAQGKARLVQTVIEKYLIDVYQSYQ